MKTLLGFVVDRAKERSTWIGLIGLLSALGVVLSPDQVEAISALGVALAGAVGVMTRG